MPDLMNSSQRDVERNVCLIVPSSFIISTMRWHKRENFPCQQIAGFYVFNRLLLGIRKRGEVVTLPLRRF